MDDKGWKTSEFWLSLMAVIVTYLIASGDFGGEYPWLAKALTVAAAVLASLGYTASRAVVKRGRLRR